MGRVFVGVGSNGLPALLVDAGRPHHRRAALAECVASLCLAHAGVERVDVTVEKPGSLRFARSAVIELTRSRS